MLSALRPAVEPLHRSPVRVLVRFTSSTGSIPSTVYPNLYYHKLSPTSTSYSLSYLPNPPPDLPFSPTTLGILSPLPPCRLSSSSFDQPPQHQQETHDLPPITPRNFQDNPEWTKLVHEVLKHNVQHDPWMQTLAKSVQGNDTFIHIADARAPADANRQPHPQDVIASVLVQNGKIVPESYEANKAAYRLVSQDGLQRLPSGLHEKVVEACHRVWEVEKEAAQSGTTSS
ncbi:hypothetical protein JCM11641_000738 [Rhodosporidiobolus odoratus]